ncbi:hypothetical protein KFL_005560160 [Klebsormidium nitens]|uniref:Uncharacterized protein n=1 Tax=Klebsormidium nitens TaxID=105231 RepID=A0A1Y1INQ0_KLENI|nr:hypothetical protein KFL_005560160 [Klebsormidium nitens]|eukprot:GAQ89738.1 hypothetical protein KFL_005560160 [Klebsormidium nitens]
MAKRKYTLQIADGMSADISIERPRTEGNVRVYTAAEALQEKERKAAEKKEKLLKKRKAKEDERNEKKIAQILALADETRRMIREMREVVEQTDSDEVLLKDKVDSLFKLMRCAIYESDEIEVVEVPDFLDRCTLCGTAIPLHESHLWLDDVLKAAWMCSPCRNGLTRSVAFKERLNVVRQDTRKILDGLLKKDDPELKDMCLTLMEIFCKMEENSRSNITAGSEVEDDEDDDEKEAVKFTQLAIWEEVEANLPTYESLKASDTLTGKLPDMRKVLGPVENRYMQFFSKEHERSLVHKSVTNRNTASKARCSIVGRTPQLLTDEEAMAAWLRQERRMKGYFVELRRYDEFALETLQRVEENLGEMLAEDLRGDLMREIERQSMRQTYVKAVLKERGDAKRALKAEKPETENPKSS